MTRTIGAAIGLMLVVLFFASLEFEWTHVTQTDADIPAVTVTARK